MRALAISAVLLATACAYEPLGSDPAAVAGSDDEEDDLPLVAIEPMVSPTAVREPLAVSPPGAAQWSFAVLSDLHLPNPRSAVIAREVDALIAMHVRFVIVTGDHTNGAAIVDHRRARVDAWWASVTSALAPLREAGISVLPIAGNHDTYLAWQREGYERAFADLDRWAAPLQIHPATGHGFARAPYSYSVDVDGIHLALANIVDQSVDRDVATWLTSDLDAASNARVRMVFGHVPLVSVVAHPARHFIDQLGAILARGNVDFYVAGHEHVTWDETFAVGAGELLRQVTVGCASGFYVFAPSKAARARAGCQPSGAHGRLTCAMPDGGPFELVRDRSQRLIEHDSASFTVFTVTGDDVQVAPMTVDDDGHARAFYLLPWARPARSGMPLADATPMNLARAARTLLGGSLIFAGIGHLSFARREFQAQVPDWVPLDKDRTVLYSGIAEIALGSALVLASERHQAEVGKIAAAFFVAVFPGNVSQYVNRRDAFGLDTDTKRLARLFFQPVLVYWALQSTPARA